VRVLITNHALVYRGGSELYVRDVGKELLRRGHTPIAYSTKLGEVAVELRNATVPVVDDLTSVSVPPDIIHGQHHIETMSALLHFSDVPAVYFCHSWLAWEESPPHFPRILRYVAVDDTCRDRLVCERGIPDRKVSVIRNFVDLARFQQRTALPEKPRRALVFSNYATCNSYVNAIRAACERVGLPLDVVGLEAGSATDQPESLLANYDLVFAKGRCAFEAMAVGAAVILCDFSGMGPMVTSSGFNQLKRFNFGVRALSEPVKTESILKEIARYDRDDAEKVTQLVRATSGVEAAVDQIVSLYEEVIEEYRSMRGNRNGTSASSEARYTAAYLRDVADRMSLQREAIYQSVSYRIGNFFVRTPVISRVLKKIMRNNH
jgi:Glycosyltransferase Family 4